MTSEALEKVSKYVGGTLGAIIVLGLLGRLGSSSASLASLAASALGLILALGVCQKLFTSATATAIRRWHVGQLVMFWLAAVLLAALLVGAIAITPTSTTRYVNELCPPTECPPTLTVYGTPTVQRHTIHVPEPHPTGDIVVRVLALVIAVMIPTTGIAITWLWFGGRRV